MPRYIDAEKIEYKTILFPVLDGMLVRTKKIENIVERQEIDKIPTADVQEVTHGKWSFKDDITEPWKEMATCSVCKGMFYSIVGKHYNFCPNCGARMDEL